MAAAPQMRESRFKANPDYRITFEPSPRRVRVKFGGECLAVCRFGKGLPFGQIFHGRRIEAIEKLRIDFANAADHGFENRARFGRSVAGRLHVPETMENDSGERMHHGGEGGDGKNVAGDFDGALLRGALDLLNPAGMRHRTHMPNVGEDSARLGFENLGELAIIRPGAGDGLLVNGALDRAEEIVFGRNVSLGAIQANVTLALLLGIIERMSMKERPDELAADVFEAEFEMRVLIDSMMAAVESCGADIDALLLGDFFGADDARRIACAGGGDSRIIGMREEVAQGDARRGSFDGIGGKS